MGGESKELSLEYLLRDVSCRAGGRGVGVGREGGRLSKPGHSLMSVLKMEGVC